MKKLLLPFFVLLLSLPGRAQTYWQQELHYILDVSLDDRQHSLEGFEKLEYVNHSPDTLFFIWFHLWPNAYKNDQTAFSEQMLLNGRTEFYFSRPDQRGYINRLDFKVDGVTARTEDHPLYIDIVKLVLPRPLAPGGHISIATPFHVQLPQNFSRGGHVGQSYQVTQWYPKPAVYDHKGWHPMPYLDQGEYFSEFGSYDVRITLPKNYVVAATGQLQEQQEKQWLRSRGSFSWEPVFENQAVAPGSKAHQGYHTVKKVKILYPPSATEQKTLHYLQDQVHDFAWFADKRWAVKTDTVLLPGGRSVEAWAFFTHNGSEDWKNAIPMMKNILRYRSELIGEYPYPVVSAVEAEMGFPGGMEYPTITSLTPVHNATELEGTLEHELGHNWFYGILATNERDHPWMDEGVNTYYDNRYEQWKQERGLPARIPLVKPGSLLDKKLPENESSLLLAEREREKTDQPINTSAMDFSDLNYGLVAYTKTGDWLKLLETRMGRPQFDSCMRQYFRLWEFRHPYPEDFRAVFVEQAGPGVEASFSLLDQKGPLVPAPQKHRPLKPTFLWSGKDLDHYQYLSLLPALGYNAYDDGMLGLMAHNYQLPQHPFEFMAATLYGVGSTRLNFTGRASYQWIQKNGGRRDLGLAYSSFTYDQFQPEGGAKLQLAYRKWAPYFRLTFPEADPLAKRHRYLQWKTFLLSEDSLAFRQKIVGTDTSMVGVKGQNNTYYINQLKLVWENNRALYPYNGELQLEQSRQFARLTFTGNYFFNYGFKQGGLNLRFFAGKFFYLGNNDSYTQLVTDRFHLNMTGANGNEDYTYSGYFVGRNKFNGLPSQQILARDGFFKIRTDLLINKIGKTDRWLTAVNLTSDIPDRINPLSILPFRLPLKVFMDIGTYADAWDPAPPTSKFLYEAGLQLSLLKGSVNIYLPILFSSEFRDYFNSNYGNSHFAKSISFNIDLTALSLRKLSKELDF